VCRECSLRLVGAHAWDTGDPIDITIADGLISRSHSAAATLDVRDLTVAPGLIDIQVNGGFGHDFSSDPNSIWAVASQLPQFGVTAFLPTIISTTPDIVATAQQVLRAGPPPGWEGAIPLGLHCEGPMIAPGRRGTHPAWALLEPTLDLFDRWGGLDRIRMVTLAPELPGAGEVTRHLVSGGVVVAAGHSDADFATATDSFGWGISHGTHLFNAMSWGDHRHPGLAAALLATPSVTVGLIADGVHVHPGVVATAYCAKGPSGITLVTDAMAAMGLGDGTYPLGDAVVVVEGNRALNQEGRLAGGVLTLDHAVRNLRHFTGCSPTDAIAAASVTPAEVIGDKTRGGLTEGMRGDITLFDDSLTVRLTVVGGNVLFTRNNGQP